MERSTMMKQIVLATLLVAVHSFGVTPGKTTFHLFKGIVPVTSAAQAPTATTPLYAKDSKNNSDSSKDATPTEESTGDNSKTPIPSKTIFQSIDDAGLSLKPKALNAQTAATDAVGKKKKFGYSLKSCLLMSLFISYRAYRGFFVILPAVFDEVYRKMKYTVDSPFDDILEGEDDINPKTGKLRWRTKVTVTVLSGIVTLSYVITGALRVLMQLMKSLQKESPTDSFKAAAEMLESNEGKIMRLWSEHAKVNGDDEALDGLAP